MTWDRQADTITATIAGQPILVDVTDRLARLLGHVQIDGPTGGTADTVVGAGGLPALLSYDPRLREVLEELWRLLAEREAHGA